MATSSDLIGSFEGMGDTFFMRCRSQQGQVASRCWGVTMHYSAAAQRIQDQAALAPQSPTYDPVIRSMDEATRRMGAARTVAERLAALNLIDGAISDYEALLDA